MNHRPAARFAQAAATGLIVLLAISLGFPQGVAALCAGPDCRQAVEFAAGPEAAADGCGCTEACGSCRDAQVEFAGPVCRPAPSPHRDASPEHLVAPAPAASTGESLSQGRLAACRATVRSAPPTAFFIVALLI